MLKNTASSYGWPMKLLHWLIAILVTMQFFYILAKNNLPEGDPNIGQMMMLHKASGFVIFWLGILFVLWRLANRKPDWPATMSSWQQHLANITHALLYILIILMPLSGILMGMLKGFSINFFNLGTICATRFPQSEALADYFHTLHLYTVWLLGTLIILHIIGALVHKFFYKDDVLKKML